MKKNVNREEFVILCKEYSKEDNKFVVYLVGDAKDFNYTVLSIRSRYNNELNYYVTSKKNQKLVEKILNEKLLGDEKELPSNIYIKI